MRLCVVTHTEIIVSTVFSRIISTTIFTWTLQVVDRTRCYKWIFDARMQQHSTNLKRKTKNIERKARKSRRIQFYLYPDFFAVRIMYSITTTIHCGNTSKLEEKIVQNDMPVKCFVSFFFLFLLSSFSSKLYMHQ